jgi:hypothetical protein
MDIISVQKPARAGAGSVIGGQSSGHTERKLASVDRLDAIGVVVVRSRSSIGAGDALAQS